MIVVVVVVKKKSKKKRELRERMYTPTSLEQEIEYGAHNTHKRG